MKRLLIAAALLFAPMAAKAATCPGYPYTLTNGQTADANQVMANFNTVLNCVTGNAAQNGINGDINQITGLTTPLAITEGGTGNTTGLAASATKLATPRTISLTGDVTYTSPGFDGSANVSAAATLASSGVTPGTYTNAQITVDAKGRVTAASVSPTVVQVMSIGNQQLSGTGSGETINATTWTQRGINTVFSNTITGASLTSNQITLPAGTYHVSAKALANTTSTSVPLAHKLRWRDVTAGSSVIIGPGYSTGQPQGTSQGLGASLEGIFTIAAPHVFELDSYVSQACNGGSAANSGETEVYSTVFIEKVA